MPMFSKHILFLPSVLAETAGLISNCRDCTLCGSAGSFSHFTGLLTCCVPCIKRSEGKFQALILLPKDDVRMKKRVEALILKQDHSCLLL